MARDVFHKRTGLVLLVATLLAVALGFLDALVDGVLLDHGTLAEEFLRPTTRELWLRSLIAVMTFVFVALVARARHAERKLRLFSQAVEDAPDGVRIIDRRGRILYGNKAIQTMAGWTPAEYEGVHVSEMSAEPELIKNVVLPAVSEKGKWEGEFRAKRKNGDTFPVWLTTSAVRDAGGDMQAIIGILRDITERKKAEHALRDSEERFRRVFEEGPAGMAITDLDGQLLQVNEALCQLLGFSTNELVGRTLVDIAHPEDLAATRERLGSLRSPALLRVDLETRALRKDGSTVWVHLRASVMHDENGKPTYGLAMFSDATERVRDREAMRIAKETAEAADRMKSEFLDIASHELRTPLNALGLGVQAAQMRLAQGQPIGPDLLDRLRRQTLSLGVLTRDLLDTSRLERQALVVAPMRIDLRALVSAVVDDQRSQMPGRVIDVDLPETSVWVDADPARIGQVVTNLLDNAGKYSPEGTPIAVRLAVEPSTVRLSVADHGQGIPAEQQRHLFTRFFRVSSPETASQSGLGLGLYICKGIIEQHGGQIAVHSEAGGGATFHFTLPRPTAATLAAS